MNLRILFEHANLVKLMISSIVEVVATWNYVSGYSCYVLFYCVRRTDCLEVALNESTMGLLKKKELIVETKLIAALMRKRLA